MLDDPKSRALLAEQAACHASFSMGSFSLVGSQYPCLHSFTLCRMHDVALL
jgi:hypothetical protein